MALPDIQTVVVILPAPTLVRIVVNPGSVVAGFAAIGEIPTGAINGVNTNFTTLGNFSLLWVYMNGLRMKAGSDYNTTGPNTFVFLYAPQTGDVITVDRM